MSDRTCTTCSSLIPRGKDGCQLCSLALIAMSKLVSLPNDVRKWECVACTLRNPAGRPDCEACSGPPPQSFKVTKEEVRLWNQIEHRRKRALKYRQKNKQGNVQLLEAYENLDAIEPLNAFICKLCICGVEPKDGISLKNCGHTFCRKCLSNYIAASEEADVGCPYAEMEGAEYRFRCEQKLRMGEIRAIASEDVLERLEHLSISAAERTMQDSFHCKTANCRGFCVYEEGASIFVCPICKHWNCISCQDIHEGEKCWEYRKRTNKDEKDTEKELDRMLGQGLAMRCCTCKTIVTKTEGCDWLQCWVCRTELCWATKGPRWGPGGHGDTSGGCRCRVNGVYCSPDCNFCQ